MKTKTHNTPANSSDWMLASVWSLLFPLRGLDNETSPAM